MFNKKKKINKANKLFSATKNAFIPKITTDIDYFERVAILLCAVSLDLTDNIKLVIKL